MATPKDAIPANVESQWYQALFEEDCTVVMALFDAYPSILKVGWQREPSRQVEGRMRRERTGRTDSSWRGRTALHVAASRGCLKLIMKVLRRCNLDGFSEVNAAYERTLLPTLLDKKSALTHPTSDGKGIETISATMKLAEKTGALSVVAEEKDAVSARSTLDASNGRNVSVEKPAGDSQLAESEGPCKGESPNDYTIPHSDPLTVQERAQEARNGDSGSKDSAGKLRETVSTIISRLAVDKSRMTARQLVTPMERQRTKKESNPDASSRDYVSKADRRHLLLAKDGESGLDALAIAVLHGKEEVINLLRYSIGKAELDDSRYSKIAVDASETSSMFDEIATRNREKRKLLRQMTVAAAMVYIEIESDNEDAAESVNFDELPPPQSEDGNNMPIAIDKKVFDEYLKVHDASSTFLWDKVVEYSVFKDYFEHRDFNFLPPEEYLFHFLCSGETLYYKDVFHLNKWVSFGIMETLWMAVRWWSGDDNLWRFLLQELTDGQGRPPFHIAVEDSNIYYVTESVLLQSDNSEDTKAICVAMSAPDESGRTPVQKTAAAGGYNELSDILFYADKYDEAAATCHEFWRSNTEDWGSSWAHDFPLMFPLAQTPLQAALINKNFSCAELLLKEWLKRKRLDSKFDMAFRSSDQLMYSPGNPAPWPLRGSYDVKDLVGRIEVVKEWIEWDLLELSCLVGAPLSFVEKLTGDLATPRLYDGKKDRKEEKRGQDTTVVMKHKWHPLHLAASFGRYDLVKYFIGDLKWDPFIEDSEGNSALHYAMKVREFELPTHLLNYVDVEHYSLSKHNRANKAKEAISQATEIAERQGCINFLLQAGCDVFRTNKGNQVPYPTGSLKDDKFLFWWYAKQDKEFTAAQNNLNFATNAIAITATLVATASYVGPLQPPLGYDSNHIQYTNGWVSTFIVCDTLSFYLAIVAITLSLIPSLPMPQQAMMEELQRTREMVIMAIGILLPSIFFVFIAFACSSISVMSANITSEVGGILVIVATVVGIVLCLLAFILFFIRLLAFIFPKNNSIRYVYDLSFLTKYLEYFSKVLSRGRGRVRTLRTKK